jgi:hypothetical protein
MGARLGLIECLPLAARSQDVEDRIGTVSVGHSRSPTTKAMGVDMHWQQGLQHGPQFIGNARIRSSSDYSAFAFALVSCFLVCSYLLL